MLPSYDEIDFVLKVVLCGQEACGKTSLVRRFSEEHFSIEETPTLGVGLYIRAIPATDSGRVFKLQIWDTSGKPRFNAVSGGWFQGAAVYIFVYSVCSRQSFDQLQDWLKQAQWIGGKRADNPKAIGLLVGTQLDRVTYREVETEQGQAFANQHGLRFFETSALTGEQVTAVFQGAVNVMDGVCRELTQQELLPLMPEEEEGSSVTLIQPVVIKKNKCCFFF